LKAWKEARQLQLSSYKSVVKIQTFWHQLRKSRKCAATDQALWHRFVVDDEMGFSNLKEEPAANGLHVKN
jgi:hypothetical protein